MHKDDRFLFFAAPPGGRHGGPGDFTIPVPGPPFPHHGGPMHFVRHRRRMRRGDVRAAILVLLDEGPRNGYQVMQEIERRSEGAWRPSPGSVYPALQLLADEGLIRSSGSGEGGNVYELTDAGRAHVQDRREQLGEPWRLAGAHMPEGARELGGLLAQVGVAVQQVMHAGDEQQLAAASKRLSETRSALYRILAGDEPSSSG
jgi:DNA-binding PadR family transcriptional regulator